MHTVTRMVALITTLLLSGCYGESLCDSYKDIPALDRDNDNTTDYRYHVIGDSILAYHEINCKSVGHRVGLELSEQVLTNATVGAKVHEIQEQFIKPSTPEADYDFVFVNGGLNDLITKKKVGAPEETPCDCNGTLNHDACLEEIEDISTRMEDLIDHVQAQSNSNIALIAYYPAERLDSFIGECFPYVELLNQRYRDLAEQGSDISFVETYGVNQPVIQKVNTFGQDFYHPAPNGSAQIAEQTIEQLNLLP